VALPGRGEQRLDFSDNCPLGNSRVEGHAGGEGAQVLGDDGPGAALRGAGGTSRGGGRRISARYRRARARACGAAADAKHARARSPLGGGEAGRDGGDGGGEAHLLPTLNDREVNLRSPLVES